MTTNEKQRRRKCSKPVPFRDLQYDEGDVGRAPRTPISTVEHQKSTQPDEKENLSISDVSSLTATMAPPAAVAEVPRCAVKTEILVGNEENICVSESTSGKTSSRNKSKKRLPLSDNTKTQAAKRNCPTKSTLEIAPDSKKESASKNEVRKSEPNIDSSEQPQKKAARRKRRSKKADESELETKKTQISEECKTLADERGDVRKTKMHEVINEVLDIVQYPKTNKLCQALDDVLIEGIPLAVSAARQGFPEFYLRTFIEAIMIHIRQTCPELL